MADVLPLARVSLGLAFLTVAAVSDWRTRQVSNKVWLLMGSIGMLILGMEMVLLESEQYTPIHFLIFIPICILFFDVFWDREPVFGDGVNIIPVALYVLALGAAMFLLYEEGATDTVVQLLTIPGLILVAYLFYFTGLLHGGADAKAFMSLAVLLPFYPHLWDLPLIQYSGNVLEILQLTFPFAFLVLMNAAILQVITVPSGMLIKNVLRRDVGFPEMFLGYQMDIDDVPKKFVWPMEVVRDGEIVLMLFPRREGNMEKELAELRKLGVERIWVTPKVPFIIPMLMGLVFSVLVGNLIMLVF